MRPQGLDQHHLLVGQAGSTPKEVDLMHKLAKLSDEERRRIITASDGALKAGADEDVKADQTHQTWPSAAATFAAGYLSECPWPEATRGRFFL